MCIRTDELCPLRPIVVPSGHCLLQGFLNSVNYDIKSLLDLPVTGVGLCSNFVVIKNLVILFFVEVSL